MNHESPTVQLGALKRVCQFVFFFCVIAESMAQTPVIDARYERLAHDLRCLVCQNQSLAESSAELAEDLKREVRALIAQGKSDTEIKTFLSTRYGDFILYKPPVQSNTVLLWWGPFIALAAALTVGWIFLRKRNPQVATHSPPTGLTESEQTELEDRLR